MNQLRALLPLGLFVAMAVFLYLGLGFDPQAVDSPLVGKPAPRFSTPDLDDANQLVTENDLRGKVTIVNVWASWCAPCRIEHPIFVAAAQDSELQIVGLNYKDQREDAQRWLAELGNPYKKVGHDYEGRAAIEWGIIGVPETFVLDQQGVVHHKHTGPVDPKSWQEEIVPIIKHLKADQ